MSQTYHVAPPDLESLSNNAGKKDNQLIDKTSNIDAKTLNFMKIDFKSDEAQVENQGISNLNQSKLTACCPNMRSANILNYFTLVIKDTEV